MRFQLNPITILVSLLFLMFFASAHTVHCAGKALAANKHDLDDAIKYLHRMAEGKLSRYTPGDMKVVELGSNSCEQLVCYKNVEVRWCNEDPYDPRTMKTIHIAEGATVLRDECGDTYKGHGVAGGYLTHPDKWAVIVQEPSKCDDESYHG
ncbi:hypothetical protein BDW74DRAFT_177924 [Aspergillus multicolor]|uniref:uncharacterized protein n=1 Tax=Aspergillus multicolor TaxID=41759 RepID=UPI003CCD8E23